jgi:hypothetical protein
MLNRDQFAIVNRDVNEGQQQALFRYDSEYSDDPDVVEGARGRVSSPEWIEDKKGDVHTEGGVSIGSMADPVYREEFRTRQYFHGSPNRLREGDRLTPGVERDVSNYGSGRNQAVFMTPFQDEAADWASAYGEGRGYVYEVEPHGLVEQHDRFSSHEFQAKSAVVKRRWRAREDDYGDTNLRRQRDKPTTEQLRLF